MLILLLRTGEREEQNREEDGRSVQGGGCGEVEKAGTAQENMRRGVPDATKGSIYFCGSMKGLFSVILEKSWVSNEDEASDLSLLTRDSWAMRTPLVDPRSASVALNQYLRVD